MKTKLTKINTAETRATRSRPKLCENNCNPAILMNNGIAFCCASPVNIVFAEVLLSAVNYCGKKLAPGSSGCCDLM